MSTSNLGLGVAFPKMLPITGTWTVPIALYSLFLSNRVVYYRFATKTLMGEQPSNAADSTNPNAPSPLTRAVRSFANYMETAPLAVAIASVLELNGANKRTLNYALGAYFVSRVLHYEIGLMNEGAMGLGRPIGYYGTQALLLGSAVYLTNLVKGYWGF